MDIQDLRQQIDAIDNEIAQLFAQRMEISAQVAAYKKEHNLPIHVPSREEEILKEVAQKVGPELENYCRVLYSMIFELSRSYQRKQNAATTALQKRITGAIKNTPQLFPQAPVIACLGVEDAYSQIACGKIFKEPFIQYFDSFAGVFQAIETGQCEYGILPIEDSTAGSVNKVYDLLSHHNFSIVRSCKIKIDHNLIANKGADLSQIITIYSHEQAIKQCSDFLKELPGMQVIPVENTAVAADMVAKSGSLDVAAISSIVCEEIYGLKSLAYAIQDKGNNRKRFICISKNLEIYPDADKSSVMMVLNHKQGALYKVLARLYALGINVIKLESRQIPEKDFEFMFYFDLETSIYSEEFIQLICELEDTCKEFKYLGSYTEVV